MVWGEGEEIQERSQSSGQAPGEDERQSSLVHRQVTSDRCVGKLKGRTASWGRRAEKKKAKIGRSS